MKQNADLQQAERKAFASRYQDGLWDVYLGSITLLFALAPLLSERLGDFWSSFIFLPFWLVVIGIITWVRRRYVNPRLGSVTFRRERKLKMLRVNLVLFGVLLAGVLLTLLGSRLPEAPRLTLPFGTALIFLVVLSAIAYFMEYSRLYVYAILLAVAALVGELLWQWAGVPHHGHPVTFGIASLVIILAGLWQYRLFIKNHPIAPEIPQS